MKIVKLSHDFTPLREGILFGIDTETDEPSELEVKIIEMATGEVIATKLLRNATTATINIAPYIEFLEEYCPASNQCSFEEAPTASYKICVGDSLSEEVIVSVNRCTIDSTPAVVSSLPNTRRIARGEEDEVLILAEQGKTIYAEIVADRKRCYTWRATPRPERQFSRLRPTISTPQSVRSISPSTATARSLADSTTR